jgi:Ser/Thr protein kinase RdoA (MazF antagonist)
MTEIVAYDDIAEAALVQYNLAHGERYFLGHSDSITFRIEVQEEKFLLRIHQAISDLQDDIWQKPAVIESELVWLDALARETKLTVQRPIKNPNHQWVTLVEDPSRVLYCSLLQWVEGEISQTERTPQQAHQLGRLLAQLHQQSQHWKPPQNFTRPSYDQERFKAGLMKLYAAVSQELVSVEDYNSLEAAVHKILTKMDTLERDSNTWGLIHADLHNGNYLLHDDDLRPIDFARCGFGYYLYDIASTIQYLPLTVRPSFFEGYQKNQPFSESNMALGRI